MNFINPQHSSPNMYWNNFICWSHSFHLVIFFVHLVSLLILLFTFCLFVLFFTIFIHFVYSYFSTHYFMYFFYYIHLYVLLWQLCCISLVFFIVFLFLNCCDDGFWGDNFCKILMLLILFVVNHVLSIWFVAFSCNFWVKFM